MQLLRLGPHGLDDSRVGLLDGLLDEAGHEDVAAKIDVLPDVQARRGGAQTQLLRLGGLAGEAPADGPLLAHVEPHGRPHVRLQTDARQVVEGGRVGDLAGEDVRPGQVGDLVGHGVPGAVALGGVGVVRGGDGVALDDEGVEVDHGEVVVEEGEGGLAVDVGGEGGDGGECGSGWHFVFFNSLLY